MAKRNIVPAVVGAVLAVVIVAGVGVAVHRPLARVPENTLKFVVGVMLTSFGTFWGAEGSGVSWPGSDLALLGVIAFTALTSLGLVVGLWRLRGRHPSDPVLQATRRASARSPPSGRASSSATTGVLQWWWWSASPQLQRSCTSATSTRGGSSRRLFTVVLAGWLLRAAGWRRDR